MNTKRLVVVIVIGALLSLGLIANTFASDNSWELDCYGKEVVVKSVGIAHYKVKCVGIAAPEVTEVKQPAKKVKRSEPEVLGYPAPGDEPYPAPPKPTEAPIPTRDYGPTPTWAPTMDPRSEP